MNWRSFIPSAVARLVCVGLLLSASQQHSWDYYTILRWVSCAVCAYLAVLAFKLEKTGWVWIFVVCAALFNPVFPVRLEKSTWTILDLALSVLLLASLVMVREKKTNLKPEPSYGSVTATDPEANEGDTSTAVDSSRGVGRGKMATEPSGELAPMKIGGWLAVYRVILWISVAGSMMRTFGLIFVPDSRATVYDPIAGLALLYIAVSLPKRKRSTISFAKGFHSVAAVISLISLLAVDSGDSMYLYYVAASLTAFALNILFVIYLSKSWRVWATFSHDISHVVERKSSVLKKTLDRVF